MEDKLDKIWEYIDGNLDKDQRELFQAKLASDSAFKSLYESQLKLNKVLSDTPLYQAPKEVLPNILSQIALSKDLVSNPFAGIKNIILGLCALAFAALVLAVFMSQPDYSVFSKYTLPLASLSSLDLSSSTGFLEKYTHLVPYSLALLIFPILFWFENISLAVIKK